MGVIEETRQLLQDFLAPELRAIGARLTSIEERLNRLDARFDRIDEKFDQQDRKTRELFADLRAEFLFDRRLSKVETQIEEQKRPA